METNITADFKHSFWLFKSYYVVWKHITASCSSGESVGLNRTM